MQKGRAMTHDEAAKLVAKGIPRNEISWLPDSISAEAKERFFAQEKETVSPILSLAVAGKFPALMLQYAMLETKEHVVVARMAALLKHLALLVLIGDVNNE
jgi:hypothetical protein